MSKKRKECSVNASSFREKFTAVVKAAAKALRLGNLSVLPTRMDGSMSPFPKNWERYQTRIVTINNLMKWYANKLTGIGYVCGAVSGRLECLAFYDWKTYKKFCQKMRRSRMLKVMNRLDNGYREKTPYGIQFLFRCEEIGDSVILATRPKLLKDSTRHESKHLIELYGEGGYVVCSPSFGKTHRDGKYELLNGGLTSIPHIAPHERLKMLNIARSFHVPDSEEVPTQSHECSSRPKNKGVRP